MSQVILNTAPVNLIITGFFVLIVILIVMKTIKELTFKIGDKSVSFSSKKAQSEIVKIVTDYADFKYRIKEEQTEGIRDLHSQAKRSVSLQLEQYVKHITVDYMEAVREKENQERTTLIMNIFSLLIRLLYNELFQFCMEIYECNHLKDKSDSELRELSEQNYMRMTEIFREFFLINWIEAMGSYDILREVCMHELNFSQSLIYQMLLSFRDLSRQQYELINTINDIDCKVRKDVHVSGTLPNNAISILSDLYIPGTGLNKSSVERWLLE